VISRNTVKGIIRTRRNRPLFFIDIAVPRDIDPEINWLTNSYVYDIDDLKGVIDENIEDRQREAIKGERIIDETVIGFKNWRLSLEVVPTIVALRSKLESIAEDELRKTLKSSQMSQQRIESIKKMTQAIINKVLHGPTIFLKKSAPGDAQSQQVDMVRKLFKLDE
jgi:glutamyl-tRNA reductase